MAKKILVAIFFLFLVLSFRLPVAYAAEEFSTSYDVSYVVGTDGVTDVSEKITLRNLTKEYYATQFSLTIGATQIFDISATDPGGAMEVKQERTGTQTTVTAKFNQQVAGKDKTLPWTLRFRSKDFASRQGKIWEVSAPKIASTQNLENYNLSLSIPQAFGEVTAISPPPRSREDSGGFQIFTFNKDALLESGVSANFGTLQLNEFGLSYPLENPNLISLLVSVPLPPDTGFQDVAYSLIEPEPLNVTVDDDGNYLAWYKLDGRQRIDVKVKGLVKLYMNSKVKDPKLPESLKLKYLLPQKYWDLNHPLIKTKLSEILGPSKDQSNYEKAKLIHRAVVNSLKYDAGRVKERGIERLGAVTALNNPGAAVCMEFTDLFIALSRAAGIPSRELNGFAYTPNPELRPLSLSKDILHAWPEFWDEKQGWVMVDPTWESTTGGVDYFSKFDLNHFVFAVKGISSTSPSLNTEKVTVLFSDEDFKLQPKIEVEILTPNPLLSGFPNKLKIKLKNSGNSLQQSSNLNLTSGKITILGANMETGPIPAFGVGEFEYDLRTKTLLEDYKDTIEVQVAGQKIRKDIEVKPFIIFRNFPLVLIGLISLIGLIYFAVLGGLIIRRRILKISPVNVTRKNKSRKSPQ